MARRRDRYRIKPNSSLNGVNLGGVIVADLGMTTGNGTKSPYKRDNQYHHMRVQDPKQLRALGLHPLKHRDFFVLEQHLKTFYEGPLD